MTEFLKSTSDNLQNITANTANTINNTASDTIETVNNFLEKISSNQYLSSFIVLFFVVYGSAIGSGGKPPKFIIDIFKNPIARIIMLILVAFIANRNIQVSVVMGIAFYLTQQFIFKQEMNEKFYSLEKFQNMYYLDKLSKADTPKNMN